jgi:hypothetical protein
MDGTINVGDSLMSTVVAHPDSRSRDRADPVRDGDEDGLGTMGGSLVDVAVSDVVVSRRVCRGVGVSRP